MKEGWEYKKLSDLFDITSSKRVFQSEWKSFGVPFYRAREIVQLSKNGYVDNELFITEELYTEYIKKYGKPQIGDIMVTGVGTLGICYLVKPNDKFYFKDGNIIWMKKKTDNLSEYIEYAFKSFFVKNQVNNSSGATVGTYTIIRANQTIVPIPQSIDTQKYIVEELDLLSSIIEKKKAQLIELDNLAQSLFYEMFGDPITNEKGWKIKKLGDISNYSKTRIKAEEVSIKNYVGVDNLLQKCEGKTDAAKVPEAINHIEYIKDDVLIGNIRPYLKKIWLAKYRGGCNGDVLVIRRLPLYQNTVNPIYLFKCLSDDAFFAYDMQFSKGEKMPRGDKKEILKYPIAIPPIHLQNLFASKIEAIEHQKELIKQSIKEVETLFNSRMDYYFN